MDTPGCSDPVRVAIASLVKLINLLGAEMLVGKHRANTKTAFRRRGERVARHGADDWVRGEALVR